MSVWFKAVQSLKFMSVRFKAVQSPHLQMQRSCARLTSANGKLEAFDTSVTDANKYLGAPDVWCTIIYTNGAVRNLRQVYYNA
jgi:hypothetical protein